MTVAACTVVKHFDVIEYISPGQVSGFVDPFTDEFFFQAAEKDSATALSQQLPRWLMLGFRLLAAQKCFLSSLPYCLP